MATASSLKEKQQQLRADQELLAGRWTEVLAPKEDDDDGRNDPDEDKPSEAPPKRRRQRRRSKSRHEKDSNTGTGDDNTPESAEENPL